MGKTFFSDYGFRIIFVVVFLLSFIWMGTKRTLQSNSNNVADWLPETFTETKEYNWFLRHFPHESFVVVSWDGCTMDDGRLEMFAQKLVPGQTIDNMADWMSGTAALEVELDLPVSEKPVTPNELPDQHSEQAKQNAPIQQDLAIISSEVKEVKTETPNKSPGQQIVQSERRPKEPQYFKNVMTGPRLLRFFEERYGPDSSSPLSEDEILSRLDGVLIGPQRTAADGSPLPITKYRTAMIITLYKQANEKELRKVLEKIREIGRECGVHPDIPVDPRPIVSRLASNFTTVVKDMVVGIPHEIKGIVLGGPPVDNVAIGMEGERTLYRLAGLCALVGLTISMVCFRSLRLTTFVFWTAILAAGIALATVSLTGSRCDAIMLSMPALVYVLAMSGAIHIINYYKDAIREGGLEGAAERAITVAWYPCFMASFTTAIGLGSLYFSHLIPIMKFGFYSAVAVMFTLLLLFFYLPALLHFFPSRDYAKQVEEAGEHLADNSIILKFWQIVGYFIVKYNKLVAVTCLGLMIYFFFGVFDIKTSVKMMRFYSPNAEIIAHYTKLEETIGPLVPMEVVIKFDNSRCKISTLDRLRFIEKVGKTLREKLPDDIGGVMSASMMGPSTRVPGKPGSLTRRTYEYALNGRLDKYRRELKDFIMVEGNPSLEATDSNYMATLRQLNFTDSDAARLRAVGITSLKDLLETRDGEGWHGITAEEMENFRQKAAQWEKEYGTDLWRVSMRVWSLKKDIDYYQFINNVKDVVNPMVDEFLAEKFPKESFPKHPPVIVKTKKSVFGTVSDWCVHKVQQLSDLVNPKTENRSEDIYPVSAIYTGMVPVVYKTQHELIEGLVDSLVSAFILIAIVMALILKSPTAGLLAMVPNLFPVVVVFGFMGHLGILVDVGTMMTASVAMGIAVDDTIHYLTWFRTAIDQGCTPKEANMQAYERCATAMTQTTLIGGLGLSAFAFSTFTPTQMFGVMMLAMLTVALVGDLIFLPAILAGPAGRFFIPKKSSMLDLPENVTPDMHQPEELSKTELDVKSKSESDKAALKIHDSNKNVG